jgi:membrane protein DedA with SNARE-associated domain
MHGMTAVVAMAVAWIDANPALTWAVAFLISASEAIVLIGALVPGSPILIAIGAAAGIGHVSLCGVILAAIAGAVVGDGLSYWIGHRYRERLLVGWPFATRPGLLRQGAAFFGRWGMLGVATARFLPGLRAVVPVVAGMFGMRPPAFYAANVTSAIIWAPLHILPGTAAALLADLLLPLEMDDFGDFALPGVAIFGLLLLGARHLWRRRAA